MLTIEAESQMKEIAGLYKEAADGLGYFIVDHVGAFTVPGRMAVAAERIREAAAAAVEEVKAVRDIRAGSEYKKRLAAVVARRALEKAFAAAGAPQAGGARS